MTPDHLRVLLHGKAAGNDDLRDAVQSLRDEGAQIDVRVTWEGGDVERHVAEALEDGVGTIVSGGGDGTLCEVANALAGIEATADALPTVAVLPLGTANDFATAAGIPDDLGAALRIARDVAARPVDLLRLTVDGDRRWAVNLASGGFGTQVTVETSEGLKKLLGGLAYLVTGMSRLGRIEPIAARFTGPGFGWDGGFIALGIGNGRQAGGGQALCPDALIDDGLLDLTIVPSLEGEVAATIGSVLSDGREAALERVATRARLPWLEIAATEPLTLNLDGEPLSGRHYRIECVPGRLRMHLPDGCPLLSPRHA